MEFSGNLPSSFLYFSKTGSVVIPETQVTVLIWPFPLCARKKAYMSLFCILMWILCESMMPRVQEKILNSHL